ncbi:MAG: transposase [Candidatus Omnitrophota bacterium]
MPRTARVTIENACYHIITRGNQKQLVFINSTDYEVYLSILKKYKDKHKFRLFAFCLMPNHIHLIIEVSNPIKLNKIMRGINLSYTLYFNNKNKKIGHLWQDRFKSKVIEKDSYLLECIDYIEGNPVRASLVSYVSQYPWSSYKFRAENNKLLDNLFSF